MKNRQGCYDERIPDRFFLHEAADISQYHARFA
jgi:hypothetical protein